MEPRACRSTKTNGNSSTLDAHHYPDGVVGERRTGHLTTSTDTARLHDSRCLFLYPSDRAEDGDRRARLQRSPLSAFKTRHPRQRRRAESTKKGKKKKHPQDDHSKERSSIKTPKHHEYGHPITEDMHGGMHLNASRNLHAEPGQRKKEKGGKQRLHRTPLSRFCHYLKEAAAL